jgi:transposase
MVHQEEQWVVFWCSLLSPLLLGEVPTGKRARYFQQLSMEERLLPNGQRRRISVRTLQRRWRQLRDEGVQGLYRRGRSDRGKPRKRHVDLLTRAVELKKEQPRRSDKVINRILRREFGRQVPRSTLYRHLRREGATRREMPPEMKRGRRIRFMPQRDKTILESWRESNNKKLWERAVVILDSGDSTLEELSATTERSFRTIRRWFRAFNERGIEGIKPKMRDRTKSNQKLALKKDRILEILHDRPKSYGIHRSNWNLSALATAYQERHAETISKSTVGRLINAAGYKMRKARRVLTSPDSDYRDKVELLLHTLQSLKPAELLFFVEEMGPLRVKSYGGRCYAAKGTAPTYLQRTSKGSVTLFGALSATMNQVAWFYGRSKDTQAMIDLAEILFNQHHDKSRIYITWDAASWHGSVALISWLDAFNAQTQTIHEGPVIEFVPLPSRAQFLDVIESVFSGMKRAVIHHSDYASELEMKSAISNHFVERNAYFERNPKRAGKKIWEIDFFNDFKNIVAGDYREW